MVNGKRIYLVHCLFRCNFFKYLGMYIKFISLWICSAIFIVSVHGQTNLKINFNNYPYSNNSNKSFIDVGDIHIIVGLDTFYVTKKSKSEYVINSEIMNLIKYLDKEEEFALIFENHKSRYIVLLERNSLDIHFDKVNFLHLELTRHGRKYNLQVYNILTNSYFRFKMFKYKL